MDDMLESAWNDSIQNLKNRIDSLDSNRQMQAFLFIRRIFDFANQMLDPVPVVQLARQLQGIQCLIQLQLRAQNARLP